MTDWWDDSAVLDRHDRALVDAAVAAGHQVPDAEMALARRRAAQHVEATLSKMGVEANVRYSPLGPEWSSDLDVHSSRLPERARFGELGWYDLEPLLRRIGSDAEGRWAVVIDGRVVGAVDLTRDSPPDPVSQALLRSRRDPGIRQLLELRVLQRTGYAIPDGSELTALSELERVLGGDDLPPRTFSGMARARRRSEASLRRRLRRRRRGFVVAVSGVDGAGKSTLVTAFCSELELAGVRCTRIWARPGQQLGWLDIAAKRGKKVLGRQEAPAVRLISQGEALPSSRRGIAGRAWAWTVLAHYLYDVRRRYRRAEGVVVFDRAALDSLVTLSVLYRLESPWIERLLRRALPRPDVHVLLRVDSDTAARRKPEDPMIEAVIGEQIAHYDRHVARATVTHEIDATMPIGGLVATLWRLVLDAAAR